MLEVTGLCAFLLGERVVASQAPQPLPPAPDADPEAVLPFCVVELALALIEKLPALVQTFYPPATIFPGAGGPQQEHYGP
jgi:hypothetical protein